MISGPKIKIWCYLSLIASHHSCGIAQLVNAYRSHWTFWVLIPPGPAEKREASSPRFTCHNAPHKSSVQSGTLQSRVCTVLAAWAVMTGEADRCNPIHVGCLKKFHSRNSTEQKPPAHLHYIHLQHKMGGWGSLCVSGPLAPLPQWGMNPQYTMI